MALMLRCPLCRGKFPWLDPSKGFPKQCELCHEYIGHDRADDDVVIPFMRTSGKTAAIDQTYRDMEKSSEVRAEMTGEPALKITDLKSTKHEGDIAAPPLTGSALQLQQHMDAMNARGGQFGFGAGPSGAEASSTWAGPAPYSGDDSRAALRESHRQLTRGQAVFDLPRPDNVPASNRRRG